MKKIIFVINNLNYGGAERIIVDTVNELAKNSSIDITILLLINRGVYFDKLDKNIKVTYVFKDYFENQFIKKCYWSFLLRLLKIIPSFIQHRLFIDDGYDIEVAFLEGAPTKLVSGTKKTTNKYAWIQIDPIEFNKSTKAYINFHSEKKAYSSFKKVFCVSSSVLESYKIKYNQKNGCVLLNMFDDEKVLEQSLEKVEDYEMPSEVFKIVNVGRLMPQKAQDRLIKIHRRLLDNGVDNRLYIIGDGYERLNLEKLIGELEVSSSCFLIGYSENPYKYIRSSDLYVCSSIAEGYSTIIAETIIIGTPIITTLCSGMKDMLGDSEYGIIVENDEKKLYNAIYDICINELHRDLLFKKALGRKKFFSKVQCIEAIKNAIEI